VKNDDITPLIISEINSSASFDLTFVGRRLGLLLSLFRELVDESEGAAIDGVDVGLDDPQECTLGHFPQLGSRIDAEGKEPLEQRVHVGLL